MREHTHPKTCLNETAVKSTGLQREYSLERSSYSSGPISFSDSVLLKDLTGLSAWTETCKLRSSSSFIDVEGT